MERTSNAVIGFWLLFKQTVTTNSLYNEFYKYDLAEPNNEFFDTIKESCAILMAKDTNIFILIEDVADEYILNIIRNKLYEYKIPYSKLINSKEGLNSANSLQMVINSETRQPEFVSIDEI